MFVLTVAKKSEYMRLPVLDNYTYIILRRLSHISYNYFLIRKCNNNNNSNTI